MPRSCTFGLSAGGLVLLLGGCSSLSMPKSASVVATPFKSCSNPKENQSAAVASTPDARLRNAFVWARTEPAFQRLGSLGLPTAPLVARENIQQAQRLLQVASRGAVSRTDQSVEAQLIRAIPWLNTASGEGVSETLASQDAQGAVQQGLNVIDVVTNHDGDRSQLLPDKTRDVPQTNAAGDGKAADDDGIEVASVGERERKSLTSDFQKMAAFRAFHLVTLLAAGRIMQEVNAPYDGAAASRGLRTDVKLFNVARFLSTYFDAYFRGGQFIQLTFDQSGALDLVTKRISARIGEKLNGAVPDDQIKTIVAGELGKVCGKRGDDPCDSLTLGTTSFVTRAGFSVRFAGIGLNVGSGQSLVPQATYPKASEFGPQMIRVLVEAIFDANGPHPKAVYGSTACATGLFGSDECMAANIQADELTMRIDMFAAGAEALSSAGVGALIRGGSVSALNNEAVAGMLETFAGVSSRKLVERVLKAQADSCLGRLYPVSLRVKDQ
ncbi:hypothetical protein [Paraburkholderia sp. SIMBA_054]|uniref:hypothetical protein n=1 Tax=Paraburkholderia sp. SIMBA_054 TaxID=3085795 RepID=UPI003979A3A7